MSTSFRFDSAEYVEDGYHFGDRGLGIRGADLPTTGENGGSFMANDVEAGDEDKEFRARISRWPTEGVFDPEEDGSFSYLGDADYAEYFLDVDGVQVDGPNLDGSTTIVFAFGDTTLDAQHGTYTLTGQSAGLAAQRTLQAAQGAYALTGQDIGLSRTTPMAAESGNYALTGQDLGLAVTNPLLPAQYGVYTLNGQDVGLAWSGEPTPAANQPRAGIGPRNAMRRRGYIVNGEKRWLTEEELAIVIAQEMRDISRDDVKVVKNGKIKPVPKEVWAEVSAMVTKLEKLGEVTPIEDDDEEEILLMYA